MLTISFVVTSVIKILQTVGFVRKASDEISRQDVKLKHNKIEENHLIKIALVVLCFPTAPNVQIQIVFSGV